MHINVSSEQHTHSLKQLLKNINTNPEAQTELARWGLEISQDILVVRIHTAQLNNQHLTEMCCVAEVAHKIKSIW